MKWLAAAAAIVALVLRSAWHSSVAIAFPVGSNTHRAFPISSVVFWLLIVICTALTLISILKRAH